MTSPRRPRFHLTADSGWINDPHGLTWHDGQYHQFVQYVPGSPVWAVGCHWGHLTSPDLLHWTEHPAVLLPDEEDGGCWSGSLIAPAGEPATIFYTSVDAADPSIGRIRVARPVDEDWMVWDKGAVVAEIPPGTEALAFRDPFVLHDGQQWRMVLGAGLVDGTAAAPAYSSSDLRTWSHDGWLASRHQDEIDPLWTGRGWECVQFFPLGDRWILTFSIWEPDQLHHQAYAVGTYDGAVFTAQTWRRQTHGPSYYAGSTFVDREGRRGIVYWMRGVADTDGRWSGAHSLPHLLRLDGDTLIASPHPALLALRGPAQPVQPDTAPATTTSAADIEWSVDDGDVGARGAASSAAGLTVLGGDGEPVLSLHVVGTVLRVDAGPHSGQMPLSGRQIRVIVDGPTAEIFTGGGTYGLPVQPCSNLTLQVTGSGRAVVHDLGPLR